MLSEISLMWGKCCSLHFNVIHQSTVPILQNLKPDINRQTLLDTLWLLASSPTKLSDYITFDCSSMCSTYTRQTASTKLPCLHMPYSMLSLCMSCSSFAFFYARCIEVMLILSFRLHMPCSFLFYVLVKYSMLSFLYTCTKFPFFNNC
jgi:hypothetical protein